MLPRCMSRSIYFHKYHTQDLLHNYLLMLKIPNLLEIHLQQFGSRIASATNVPFATQRFRSCADAIMYVMLLGVGVAVEQEEP